MNILVTGGAGFIGRWTVKKLLEDGHKVWILDDLSNGSLENIKEFEDHEHLMEFVKGDIKDEEILATLFKNRFDICYHLAASINVQDSIDNPREAFENDVVGTFNVLEQCRKHNTKLVFMSTCMVYDRDTTSKGINEAHSVKPASPYAGSKVAGENLVLSFWYAYKLPVVVIRPFNTYGPHQKSNGEGGVIAIFIKGMLDGKVLHIYGDGSQTRDFLYVEDCADFITQAGYSKKADGHIINAGTGEDITINDLAKLISRDVGKIEHVTHIHPQSEIQKLLCDPKKALNILGWNAKATLTEGIAKTEKWITKTYCK